MVAQFALSSEFTHEHKIIHFIVNESSVLSMAIAMYDCINVVGAAMDRLDFGTEFGEVKLGGRACLLNRGDCK